MRFNESAAQLKDAARRHLADAHRLLGNESRVCKCATCARHRVGAIYLAGYAVECALKAHAIVRRRKVIWEEVVAEEERKGRRGLKLRGGHGHSLPSLLTAASLDVTVDPSIQARFGLLVNAWSVDLRYAQGSRSLPETRAAVIAATEVHEWVLRQP